MKAVVKLIFFLFTPSVSYYSIWSKQNLKIFNIAGSSSAQNIFNSLLQGEGEYSVAIANTGSAIGLDRLASGQADFALVSYDVSEWLKVSDRSSKYKSLKLAEENIAIAYKPPSNCTQELEIKSSNVKDLFALLFGHKHSGEIKTNLSDFISDSGSKDNCSHRLIPIVKNSGPSKSGTVKSLFSLSLLSNNNNDDDWINKIKQGYGTDSGLVFIQESGLMHAEHFLKNVKDGWITYLPGSLAIQNKGTLESKGVKFAKICFSSDSIQFPSSNDSSSSSYTWNRPFNLVYSTQTQDQTRLKSFLEKIASNISNLEKIHLKKSNIDTNNLFQSS